MVRGPLLFSAVHGKFHIQRSSNTSFGRTLLASDFGGLLLEKTFAWHSAAFPLEQFGLAGRNALIDLVA